MYTFWYERYSVAGIMPDGRIARFDTDTEYVEAFDAERARASLFAYRT